MSWDSTPYEDALFATAQVSVQTTDAVGLRQYIERTLLKQACRRPLCWSEFVTQRPDLLRPLPLVYDRPSGLVFIGGLADHERCAAELYYFRQLASPVDWVAATEETDLSSTYHHYADRFIETGMGMLCGSSSAHMGRRTLVIGEHVKLTPAEKLAFREYMLTT